MSKRFQRSASESGAPRPRISRSGHADNIPATIDAGPGIGVPAGPVDAGWIEGDAASAGRGIGAKWVILSSLLALCAVGVLAIAIILGIGKPRGAGDVPSAGAAAGADSPALPEFSRPPREIAEAFLAAGDPRERLQWVRNPEAVAGRMDSYPEEALSHPVDKLVPMGQASTRDLRFARFNARFPGNRHRLLCVIPTGEGPKVDWDAYARYGSADWESILGGAAREAEVRVFLKSEEYYNYAFRDDSVWQGYKLTTPDSGELIHAYVRRDSTRGRLLAAALPKNRVKPQRMTLTISSLEGSHQHRQFEIVRVHAVGWVRAAEDVEDDWTPSLLRKR